MQGSCQSFARSTQGSTNSLAFTFARTDSSEQRSLSIQQLVIAGWTGRDRAAVEKHIAELEALGVSRPGTIPVYYRASASNITTADAIQVLGGESSGEVEFLLLGYAGRLWLGAGSDHTDRRVETYDVAVSKQMCPKPVARQWWALDDVAHHWDSLILRSYIGPDRLLYQEGNVNAMLHPSELLQRYDRARSLLPDGTLMFCGTLPAIGGIRPAARFAFEIEDPVLARRIGHDYEVVALPAQNSGVEPRP